MIATKKQKRVKAHHHSLTLMGSHFVLTAVSDQPESAWHALRAGEQEIARIENLISSWKPNSQTSRINEMSGKLPVRVDVELLELIERSISVSKLTAGAFDISGTIARYFWNFNNGVSSFLPEDQIERLKYLMDFRSIEVNRDTNEVFLKKEGMRIGFGGIGKGYAAFRASEVMKSMGIQSGLVNASGDLVSWGQPPQAKQWIIKIPNPQDYNSCILELSFPSGSVVTSGNQFNYTIIDGQKYSHIVDPRTGLPVRGVNGVTVICPNPEFGDAFATALSVLGVEEGIYLTNQLQGVESIIIDSEGTLHCSENLKDHLSI